VLNYVGNAAYKAILSDVVFNGGVITSDSEGNIYGPYFSTYNYGAYSYSLDQTNNLVNAKEIIPLNTTLLNEWVPIAQVVWAAPSQISPVGGVFILGIPNYWSGSIQNSIYYKALDADPSADPYLICDKLDMEFGAMVVDNVGNLILIHKTEGKNLLILTADMITTSITTGGTIQPIGFGVENQLNTEVPCAIACDSNGYIYTALQTAGIVLRYDPYTTNSDPEAVLFASGFSKPCALAFDSVGNLYVGNGDDQTLAGISVVSAGTTNTVTTVMNGFFVVPGSLAYNTPRDTLVFSDGNNLCYIPLSGNTTAPVSLIDALTSHDYQKIINIISSSPGEIFVLTVKDIVAINSIF
jgi:hypothetical protein